MKAFPLGLASPGHRLASTLKNRSPARLMAMVAEHLTRGHARYTPRDVTGDGIDETWCNLFAQDLAEAMGVELPRYMRANQLVEWLSSVGAISRGWEQVSEQAAQAMADQGQLAIAGWFNRNGGSGHLAVVVPSLGELMTFVGQVGATNFTRQPLSSGFGSRPVTFFAHP